ncbi:hypothetical protein C0993_004798 [Termitomyces sp. T159_Od127]|nr:hypothetical protein C0993_004798 [Termitomyces sp. T159_Od127]
MLFVRSICLVAAAAFVSLTSASPIQESGIDVVAEPCDGASSGILHVGGADVVGVEGYRRNAEHRSETRETLQYLPDILSSANDQLMSVQEEAETLGQDGNRSVNVDAIQICLDKVQGILVVVLADIKLLVGKPTDVILGGCTLLELAGLLCTVLTLVVKILLTLISCAGLKSDIIIGIIVKGISVVLCELLTIVLGLVDGLLAVLLPLLLGIIVILPSCGLGGLLKVLGL